MARLTTPYQLLPFGERGSFFARVEFPSGISLLKENGAWSARTYPTLDALEAADLYYLGGYVHDVTVAIGDEIVAAGLATQVLEDAIVEPITDEVGVVSYDGVEI